MTSISRAAPALLALTLLLTCPPALAGRGTGNLFPPGTARSRSTVYVRVDCRFMKVFQVTVDGLAMGRFHRGDGFSGALQRVQVPVRLPPVAPDGRWRVELTGTDVDGDPLTVARFVIPLPTHATRTLRLSAVPRSVRAPASGSRALRLKVCSYGMNRLRVTAPGLSTTIWVDPNQRPTKDFEAVLTPVSNEQTTTVRIEGLSASGQVLKTVEHTLKILPGS